MILLTEFFRKHPARNSEFDACLNENIKNPLITKIVLFIDDPSVEPDERFTKHEKITLHKIPSRPTYQDFFTYANQNFENEFCILANADIIVGQDIKQIESRNSKEEFYALTRWDLKKKEDGTFSSVFFENSRGIAQGSQDTWIFKTPVNIKGCDFSMGRPGCDNKLAHLAKESGYKVTNPSLAIKTYHLHESGIRNYSGRDIVPGPWQVVPATDSLDKLSDTTGHWPF